MAKAVKKKKSKSKKKAKKIVVKRKLKRKKISKPKEKTAKKTKKAPVKKTKTKKIKTKIAKPKTASKPTPAPAANEVFIGKITHFFPHVNAGIIEITDGDLKSGDKIHIKGVTTDFSQGVKSIQINREPIEHAKVGDVIGIEVISRVREHDSVYKVVR